ncbi:translation initiation factor IF-2, partial [Pyrobaculum sp.]|uniref:translation initiation factor IF-2 n=1 Tax=Pyrobaculum sp. TaxID=2004705 RepID=UPI00316D893A
VENRPFLFAVEDQEWHAVATLEERIGKLIEELSKFGIEADRYDRVRDFTKQVPIVPTSAVTGEGIADLLLVLAGVSQRFIPKEKLQVGDGPARGVVMEVKEERGLGVVADAIIYDGRLRKGDVVVTAGLEGPKEAKVRMLIMPKPLEEMRDPEDRFMAVEEVKAAAGVRIVADGLEGVVAGAPLLAVWSLQDLPNARRLVGEEISEIKIESDREGVIVHADTFGTLESTVLFLRQQGVPVRKADVGPPTHKDVVEAVLSRRKNPAFGVILAFNVKIPPDVEKEATSSGIKIIRGEILYRIFDEYLKWSQEVKTKTIEQILSQLTRPGKIQILPGFVFRRSDPVIVGVKVLAGTIKPGVTLVKDGREVGKIMQIQKQGKPVNEAAVGDEVAISIQGDVMVGRQIKEGDVLYVYVPDEQAREWLFKYKQYLSDDEKKALEEFLKTRKSAHQ